MVQENGYRKTHACPAGSHHVGHAGPSSAPPLSLWSFNASSSIYYPLIWGTTCFQSNSLRLLERWWMKPSWVFRFKVHSLNWASQHLSEAGIIKIPPYHEWEEHRYSRTYPMSQSWDLKGAGLYNPRSSGCQVSSSTTNVKVTGAGGERERQAAYQINPDHDK